MTMTDNYRSNLDRVQESEINLHGSSFCDELGLGRCNHRVGEVHSSYVRGISQNQVGLIIDTGKDDKIEVLKCSQFGRHTEQGDDMQSDTAPGHK